MCPLQFPGGAIPQVFSLEDLTNPHKAVGNGQHLANAALVMVAALCSVHFYSNDKRMALQGIQQERVLVPVAPDGRCFWASIYLHFQPKCAKKDWLAVPRTSTGFAESKVRMQHEVRS